MAPKRWVRRPDNRRAEIVEAALKSFSAKGFATSRIEDVAHAAGVSKALVYLYFDDKDDLLRAAVRDTLAHKLTGGGVWLGHDLASAVRALWEFSRQEWFLALAALALDEGARRPPLGISYARAVQDAILTPLAALLARGTRAGELRSIDADEAAAMVFDLLVMRSLAARRGSGNPSRGETPAPLVDFVLHALREPPRIPQADGY